MINDAAFEIDPRTGRLVIGATGELPDPFRLPGVSEEAAWLVSFSDGTRNYEHVELPPQIVSCTSLGFFVAAEDQVSAILFEKTIASPSESGGLYSFAFTFENDLLRALRRRGAAIAATAWFAYTLAGLLQRSRPFPALIDNRP